MLDMEISSYNGNRFGYWKGEMKEKLKWLYIMNALSKKQYNEYLNKIDNKYTELHDKMFS